MDKIEFARNECRAAKLRYRIINDALLILRNKHYVQMCFNLYNLSHAQISDIIWVEAGRRDYAGQLDRVSSACNREALGHMMNNEKAKHS